MTEHKTLAAALAAFQGEMPTVPKSQTAKVPTKAGGSYSYTYAGLADVTEAAMPLLAKHGLSFACLPTRTDQGHELVGTLLHASGEKMEGSLPIYGRTPQEIGSALTYMRRYLVGCMTGLVTDDDDDGTLASNASGRAKASNTRGARPNAKQESGADPWDQLPSMPPEQRAPEPNYGDSLTKAQLGKIATVMSKLGITERAEALGYVHNVVGRQVESRGELTKSEASRLIEALEADARTAGVDA